jgi:NAD(P)-dependent dehydrogenase (short-subunit alcohol dehydrogenase family)
MATGPIDLNGTVAVVTGANRGLGRAMALALASAGARVVLASPEAEALAEVADAIAARYGKGRALALATDITVRADCERVLTESLRAFGGQHVLVNNARHPYLTRLPLWQVDPDNWQQCIRVNVMGSFLLTHVVAPHFLAQGFGRIVNLTTSLGTMQTRNYSQYGATKTALEAMTMIWAQDFAGSGVTVNSLHPGGQVDTGFTKRREGRTPLPVDVLDHAVVWLASRQSNGKTGGRYCGSRWDKTLPPDQAAAQALDLPVLRAP